MFVSRIEAKQARLDLAPSHLEEQHRVLGRTTTLGRAARIENPDAVVALDLRHMGVPVDDRVAAWKAPPQPGLSSARGTGDVHEPDPCLGDLDDELRRQRLSQGGLVHVAANRMHRRPEGPQAVEDRRGDDVARVEHEVGSPQLVGAGVRKLPCSSRQMGVGNDRDPDCDR
jgi:hypothetical protein